MVYAQLVLRAGQSLSVASPILDNAIVASYFMWFLKRDVAPVFLRNYWSVWDDKTWIFTIAWLRCIYSIFCNLVTFRACIKIVIPFGLIGIYEFSRSLSDLSFQFCQTVIRGLHSSLIVATWSRFFRKKRIVTSIGRNTNIVQFNI